MHQGNSIAKAWVLFLVGASHSCFLLRSSLGNAFVIPSSLLEHRLKQGVARSFEENDDNNLYGSIAAKKPQINVRSVTTFLGVASKLGSDCTASTNGVSYPTSRGYCPRCKRPNVVCICHALPDQPIDCGTKILILQHPREARKRKRTSTVPLIGLSVDNVEICVGTVFEKGSHPLLDEALARNHDLVNNQNRTANTHALLLYPSPGAIPLKEYLERATATNSHAIDNPQRRNRKNSSGGITSSNYNILVVVDGTWAQTQSMVQNSYQTLWKLPNVLFNEATDSVFDALRQEPVEHCTSTLEAVSRALRLLGTSSNSNQKDRINAATNALEDSLRAMVDGQLRFALDRNVAKPRYARRVNATDSKREARRSRKAVSRRRRAELRLPEPKTQEELEQERIRFVYVAHMG